MGFFFFWGGGGMWGGTSGNMGISYIGIFLGGKHGILEAMLGYFWEIWVSGGLGGPLYYLLTSLYECQRRDIMGSPMVLGGGVRARGVQLFFQSTPLSSLVRLT